MGKSDMFHYIFLQSSKLQTVSKIWKHSVTVPVPKSSSPAVLNDFRPVELTSLVMKYFEKMIKKEVLSQVEHSLDLLFKHLEGT